MSNLVIKNLTKYYKGRTIIDNISLEIKSGEIVGLLGPNGAGKTTIFYMIAGIIQHDIGKIFIDENDISFLPLYARAKFRITYLPQEASIFRKLSVFDNLMAILEIIHKNISYKERLDRVYSLMNEFHITHLCKCLGQFLSGGERRRVEIARSLIANPKFILLDEPFAGVDPISIFDIKKIIKYLKKIGLGIFITDHNVRDTLDICMRTYIINQGKLLANGISSDLIKNKKVREIYLGEEFIL
ncbi:LPS export ABC transporter ATP-binding protein [Candidatus Schneideria nysicola]|uniref:LPS export ABC transporter ATP-binding protein n=1 Tax=Candidatus Schneideria nysicola TaxID=1081631 RepID=UPI001CAA4B67|nr:LPS export ABC transporter ATP-binding protein [Candidatus Schneideria nysicola]UAJ64837.1 LPS export ABC transporter ATP-binding protein [Candidatus Schneideria nysicola]